MFRRLLAIGTLILAAMPSHGANCASSSGVCFSQQRVVQQQRVVRQRVVKQQPVVKQQVVRQKVVEDYVAPIEVYYFVGAPVREQALYEHQIRNDPDYQEFMEFKRWQQEAQAFQQQQRRPQPQQQPRPQQQQQQDFHPPLPRMPAPPQTLRAESIIGGTCAQCHTGASAKGGIDMTAELTGAHKWAMYLAARDGHMPPGKLPKLSDAELSQLVEELKEN